MSGTSDDARLEARLRRLEVSSRRHRLLLLLALSGVGLAAMVPECPTSSLQVTSLEVVDGEGRVRARLGTTAQGPRLELMDDRGVVRARVLHEPDQTALLLHDAAGTTRVGVAQFSHGGGGFALHGEGSRGATVLYLKNGTGTLSFFAEDGTVSQRIPAQDTGT